MSFLVAFVLEKKILKFLKQYIKYIKQYIRNKMI